MEGTEQNDIVMQGQPVVKRFRGRSEHVLDEKGRLNIPSRFNDVLRELNDDRLMLIPWGRFIKAYTMPEWESLEDALLVKLPLNDDTRKLIDHISGVVECPLKQGRILLSPQLRKECTIDKEVILQGKMKLFEIWDKQLWERENRPTREDFLDWDKTLSGYGLL